jgi:integrase
MAVIETRKNADGTTSFRVKIRLKGHPTVSATFTRKTDAKLWVQQTEAAIREGRYFKMAEASKHTFSDMAARYRANVLPAKPKNARNLSAHLQWWEKKLGPRLLSDISPPVIAELRDALTREPIQPKGSRATAVRYRGPATVVRYLATLSHVYAVAVREWSWVEDNPCRKVGKPKEPRGRVRFLSDDERVRLLNASKTSGHRYLYTIVVLALSTGMRSGEIVSLTWPDIDLARGLITLQETKNGERRAVPLAHLALDLIKALGKVRRLDTNLLFPSPTKPKQPVEFRSAWHTALKHAGITNFRFHDLRHSAASYLAMNGATTPEIAEVLGHKTLHMVKRYAHLSVSHTHGVVAAMNERIFKEIA